MLFNDSSVASRSRVAGKVCHSKCAKGSVRSASGDCVEPNAGNTSQELGTGTALQIRRKGLRFGSVRHLSDGS